MPEQEVAKLHGTPTPAKRKRRWWIYVIDAVLLVAIWLSAVFIGALPFFLADKLVVGPADRAQLSMSFSEAVFESVSGFSATGYSVTREANFLAGIEVPLDDAYYASSCAHIFLFYRALTQFFGGVGLVLIVTSAISDRYGLKLFFAEGHNDRLLPNLAKTAKVTFSIYCGIILLGSFVLWRNGNFGTGSAFHANDGRDKFSRRGIRVEGERRPQFAKIF